MMRSLTERETGGLFKYRCIGIRPRSKTRTGVTIVFTVLRPKSGVVKVGLSRNKRLARNSPIGVSNGCFSMTRCKIGTSNIVSCSRILHVTGRRGPGLVITKTDTCTEAVSFGHFHRVTSRIKTCLVMSVTRVTKLITAKLRPDPVPCTRIAAAAARGALHKPENKVVVYDRRVGGGFGFGGTMFPKVRKNPLVRIVTNGTIYFGRTLRPRCGACVRRIIGGTGTLYGNLGTHKIGVISKSASGRLVLMSLSKARADKGRLRGHLSSTRMATGGGAVPGSPHSPFMADNMELKAPTIAAHKVGRSSVSGVTRVVTVMVRDRRGMRGTGTVITRLATGCPLYWWGGCVQRGYVSHMDMV